VSSDGVCAKPDRAALRHTGIAQQCAAPAAAAEYAAVGQHHPVAVPLDLGIIQTHVQRAARIGAERGRAPELEGHARPIVRALRRAAAHALAAHELQMDAPGGWI